MQVHVGGLTASSIDVSERLAARLPVFIGAVLVLSFLLLMAVFRSLLVPLKAVIMNLLSIGAAYGVVVAVFEWGWLNGVFGVEQTGPIAPFIPMMMFAILFGLSMDYEVFLLSRIREEYDRTGDNALAVADGLASTARVITAAALIMVTRVRQLRPRRRRPRSSCSASAWPRPSWSTPPSCAWCWCRPPWSCWATGTGGSRAGSTGIIPRLHVEAGPDVDAELARLAAEEEPATVGGS